MNKCQGKNARQQKTREAATLTSMTDNTFDTARDVGLSSTLTPHVGEHGGGLFAKLGQRVRYGTFTVTWPNGLTATIHGKEPGPDAHLIVNRRRAARRQQMGGDVGFGEAYMDGDVDSPDLAAVAELAMLNWDTWEAWLNGIAPVRLLNLLGHYLRPNSKRTAKKNIHRHYDLGNAFYESWLDPGMSYSSAVFSGDRMKLEAAQTEKYRRMAELAGVAPGHHVLEIGCGWGGFAEFAAGEIGAKVTGITISDEQYDYAAARIQREGLGEKVDIRKVDYRDVEGTFDRIVSIEMFEAVGERYWPDFFGKVRERIGDTGRAALQVITLDDKYFEDYRTTSDFIQTYIFPGGMLPSPGAFEQAAGKAGLEVGKSNGYGLDYARTLRQWRDNFATAWPEISQHGFDERFRRMWECYLAFCEGSFNARRTDVRQILLTPA